MTTSELKQQIEKVLGNSIRCQLPSYWWKRLFHQVADRIDEAVGNVKVDITIDSELLETSTNPVQNRAIKAAIDNVAPVFFITKTSGFSQFWEAVYGADTNIYPRGIVPMADANIEINGLSAVDDANIAIEFNYNGGLYKWIFNKSTGAFVSEEVISSSEGVSDFPIYVAIGDRTLSLEQVNANVAAYTAISNGLLSRKIPFVEYVFANGSAAYPIYMFYPTSKGVIFYTSNWDDGSPFSLTKCELNNDGTTTFVEYVYPDATLSESSTNPVQNKAVTAALNNKVDKVEGKQLSTEDFTTVLKTKLEGLSNYDDTELSDAVARLRDDFDSLTQEDISAAIENFNEIISFLDGIEDSESLDSIIASIEQQIANKQDKIEDLETIRSGAALGATALQEHQDISHLATKDELNDLTEDIITNEDIASAAFAELSQRIDLKTDRLERVKSTRDELAVQVESIFSTILENEDVISAALAEINGRIAHIEEVLKNN